MKLVLKYFHITKELDDRGKCITSRELHCNEVPLQQIKLFKVLMYHYISKNFYLYQINIKYKEALLLLLRINKQTVLMSSDVAFR